MSEQYEEVIKRVLNDPLAYFKLLKIQEFGTGAMVPFALNPAQRIVHAVAERQLKEHNMVRCVILKARRMGLSTYVQGRLFYRAATRKNKNVYIVTHSKQATSTMFRMARRFEENLPELIKPEMKYSGKQEMVWSKLGSQYGLATVGGKDVRGDKIDLLHCSEVAFWGESGEEYLLGVLNSVVQGYGTEVFLESTANGVGGIFYDRFWDAYSNPGSGWEAIFLPWYIFEEYQKPFKDEEEKEKFIEELGQNPIYGGEEEEKLLEVETEFDVGNGEKLEFYITPEHLNWRRETIRINCNGDIDQFRQEYPTTAREAFITTGRGVFAKDSLLEMQYDSERKMRTWNHKNYRVPVKVKKPEGGWSFRLEEEPNGELIVWNKPIAGREYRIGVDVSEGIEVGRDTDYSVAVVMDAQHMHEVATLRTRIDPDLLAYQLVTIGRWYNEAMLCVESNNHGLVTLKFLQEFYNYPNIYFDKVLDERSNRATRKIGFKTSIKSKPVIIDTLKELIREKEIQVNTPVVIDELMTFVYQPNGRTAAQSGSHDDCVMALALSAFCVKLFPASIESERYRYGARDNWNLHVPL